MPVPSSLPDSKLHVVTCISNPVRYASRYALYQRFAKEMAAAGVNLLTVEAAFGDRPHATPGLATKKAVYSPQGIVGIGGSGITGMGSSGAPQPYGQHLLLQTDDELWHKENMLNLGISRLPDNWEYVAWVDADITFLRPDWVGETVEALQHYPVVQMFETAADTGPTGAIMNTYTGFASVHPRAPLRPRGRG